jgi:hypothetical protein
MTVNLTQNNGVQMPVLGFDFELTTGELKALDALDTGVRGGPEPDDVTLEAYGRPPAPPSFA